MAINKAMRMALKALSYPDLDTKRTYKLQRQLEIASHPYLRPLYTMWDHVVSVGEHAIPVRIFPPAKNETKNRILIFFHGGGWVLGNIDSYTAMCAVLAKQTGHTVISVDYRLAPEFPFPAASEDCYAVAREVYDFAGSLDVDSEDIALIGDSAGGNLAAVVSLMARDRGDFQPKKQILLYPATASDHGPSSPYPSMTENGTDFLLTAKRINDFVALYIRRAEDLKNPYFAPLEAADLSRQPRTLIITAEYDPLRDEGEAYGEKLRAAGNQVEIHRMQDALHGFIMLPRRFVHVQRCYELINRFLNA